MDSQDALTTVAEIAIAIAGFSGIAVVLGRRSEGQWAPQDVLRLRLLLEISFVIVLFAFLPIVLASSPMDQKAAWAVSSGIWVLVFSINLPFNVRRMRRIAELTGEALEQPYTILIGCLVVAMLVLHLVNVVVVQDGWPYLAALVADLTLPFAMFLRLLRGILRGASAA